MNILAVIPARAGSKGIPNKNIRFIAGHPLIYYAIKNAISSKYITDVVVTTDSQLVRVIAEQMGAFVWMRDESLCQDDVTLDAVVDDVVENMTYKAWDYVVTMQPTSPTLSVDTLDKAIHYSIINDLDTVISAINAPSLSWKIDESGRKVPNYEKRLNRQYLPPCYMETGAFVVSKANVVNAETRIGSKVDVFEVPEVESQDIDDFSDLISASAMLDRKKVAIYVNGNNKIGLGHIYRTLEIADEFYLKPDIYYNKNETDVHAFGRTTHKLIPVNDVSELFVRCKREKYTIFINDVLSTSSKYMMQLRENLPSKAKIINFEDDGDGASKADLVFNALLGKSTQKNIYTGEKYYVCSKAFMFYQPITIGNIVRTILVSFGGADPQNYTERILSIIKGKSYEKYKFTIVLGRAKRNVEELMKYNALDNVKILYDVENMPEIMSTADIAITSRGRTGYELSMLGIPAIVMAQNMRETKHKFMCADNGFDYLGLNPSDEMIKAHLDLYLGLSKLERKRCQDLMLRHDLYGGRKRIMRLIDSL